VRFWYDYFAIYSKSSSYYNITMIHTGNRQSNFSDAITDTVIGIPKRAMWHAVFRRYLWGTDGGRPARESD
jgi:hypothetical protein